MMMLGRTRHMSFLLSVFQRSTMHCRTMTNPVILSEEFFLCSHVNCYALNYGQNLCEWFSEIITPRWRESSLKIGFAWFVDKWWWIVNGRSLPVVLLRSAEAMNFSHNGCNLTAVLESWRYLCDCDKWWFWDDERLNFLAVTSTLCRSGESVGLYLDGYIVCVT